MKNPLSIYIHWPFCKAKCPYCDFNSHVRDRVEHERWKSALLKELAYWAGRMPGRQVVSIFFGGGTPSLMQPATVAALIDAAGKHWNFSPEIEITLEANPTSIEAENFRAFRTAGVNRASVGIQALRREALSFLGRQHTVTEALAALAIAQKIFPRFTFDLIYARPGQGLKDWETELNEALTFANGHLSLYQLTIEENTAFHTAHKKGAFSMPDETLAADMFQLTQEIMEKHSMPAYEISNHAQAGEESRHNLTYWRGDDYIGIGPGAHGRVTLAGSRIATDTLKSPERWLEKVEQSGAGLAAEAEITPREHFEELVMMGLRLKGGIDYADWQARTGIDVKKTLAPGAVGGLMRKRMILADDIHIETTMAGRLLLNRITADLL